MFQGGCISFLSAAVTNCHKFGGLKRHRFTILEFCGSDPALGSVGNVEGETGLWSVLEVLEEKQFPGQICLLEAVHIPWPWQSSV